MKMKMPPGKFLGAVQVGEGGRIVLPPELLELFELKPGDSMMVLADKNKGIVLRRGSL